MTSNGDGDTHHDSRDLRALGARKFRKRPIVITAIQWRGTNAEDVITFTSGLFTVIDADTNTGSIWNTHHNSRITVTLGQWIVKGVDYEFYPITDEMISATYDDVTGDDNSCDSEVT